MQDDIKNHYSFTKFLKTAGASLISASSGSIPIFYNALAPEEKIKWLRPNHATPGARLPKSGPNG